MKAPDDPREPNSPEEWELEQRAFASANTSNLSQDVRELIGHLWAEVCARERWFEELADLKDGRSVILPSNRDHAEKMVLIGEAFLNPNPGK